MSPCRFRKCGILDLVEEILVEEVECFYCIPLEIEFYYACSQ